MEVGEQAERGWEDAGSEEGEHVGVVWRWEARKLCGVEWGVEVEDLEK